MDKLQPLRLFTDEGWQSCLESFLDTLSQQVSHTTLVDYRTTLAQFFQGRNPEYVDRETVETFCRQPSYHGAPSHWTIKRRRRVIRHFYEHARKSGVYQGSNPVGPPVVDKESVPHIFEDPVWQQCFTHYLEDLYRRSQSRATIISYSGILCRFFQGKSSPSKVTRADVSNFIQQPCVSNGKQGQPVAIATTNAKATVIRMFYDFASGYTVAGPDGDPTPLFNKSNPCAGLRHGQPARVHKSLSLQEVKRFFAVIPQDDSLISLRDRSCFWTFLLTCRRRSELANLRWGDLEYGTIIDEDGSSREGHLFHFRGKGRQAILDSQELPEKAYEEIRRYLMACQRWETITPEQPIWIAHGPNKGGNVRPGEIRPWSSKAMSSSLKKYARLAGIPESRFSLHSLRHTGAFLRKINGSDLFSISHTLRHKSLDMTRRYLEELVTSGDHGSKLVEARLAALGVL